MKIVFGSIYFAGIILLSGINPLWTQTQVQAAILAQSFSSREDADSLLNLGVQSRQEGNLEQAIAYWLQALQIYHRLGDEEALGLTYDYLGLTYISLNQYSQAETALRRRLAIARDRNDFQGQIYGLNNLGILLLEKANLPAAETLFQEALVIARDIKHLAGIGLSLNNLGLISANQSQYPQAIAYYQEALKLRQSASDLTGQASTLNNLGNAQQVVGQHGEALSSFRLARVVAVEQQDLANQFLAYQGIALSYAAIDSYSLALQNLEAWLNLAIIEENSRQQFLSLRSYARLHKQRKQQTEAENFYTRAISLARQLGYTEQVALLNQELAELIYN